MGLEAASLQPTLPGQHRSHSNGNLTTAIAATNPFRYNSGLETIDGLYHYGARYYNPINGRWTQQDPSGQNPGYVYARDNPINNSDPTGLDATCIVEGTCATYDGGGDDSLPTLDQLGSACGVVGGAAFIPGVDIAESPGIVACGIFGAAVGLTDAVDSIF